MSITIRMLGPSVPPIRSLISTHDLADVDRRGLQRLAPREGEEPLHEGAGPLRRLQRAVDKAIAPGVTEAAAMQDVQAAKNRSQ